jgi:hypothetical protein
MKVILEVNFESLRLFCATRYIQIISGATAHAQATDSAKIILTLPAPSSGIYTCVTNDLGYKVPGDLEYFQSVSVRGNKCLQYVNVVITKQLPECVIMLLLQ